MKAIETFYDGHRFRSRLEARWAVFFNALHIPYEYEKEGFDLDGVYYLPDFWLPEQKCWIEVKGQELTEAEAAKCEKFTRHIAQEDVDFFLFVGDIPFPSQYGFTPTIAREYKYLKDDEDSKTDRVYTVDKCAWVQCPFCEKIGIRTQGDIGLLCSCIYKLLDVDPMTDTLYKRPREVQFALYDKLEIFFRWPDHPNLITAYTAARQARFEHGEKG